MANFWPLLLPLASCSGWLVAKYYYANHRQTANKLSLKNNLSIKYIVGLKYIAGLNYILNDQTDKAVDIFIKLLAEDDETVETHLALGSLFRRRGEVDRAIRIHQNLIARPKLSILQRKEALMALGQDYMSSGVFNRAERIFLEIIALGGNNKISSLQGLLAIYQQEKSWKKALDIIKKLESATGKSLKIEAAHYYCELADHDLQVNADTKAAQALKKALNIDSLSVRASLMLAQLEIKNKRYKRTIRALKRVPEQDAEFLNEIIEPLVYAYSQLGALDKCIEYLKQILIKHPRTSVIFVIADAIGRESNLDIAIDFVFSQLERHPSIRGLNRLIYWHLETSHGKVRDKLQMLYTITSKFLENKPIYRCGHCGFAGKILHWNCPSCQQWGKIKPIHGLEGD